MPEELGYQFDRVFGQPIERYRQVSTVAERDAIPTGKRWEGMLCYVTGESIDYQLSGGTDNSNWKDSNASDGSGANTFSQKIKIGDYWVDKGSNSDKFNMEVGDKYEGWINSDTRYVVGKVISLPFDVDDNTKTINIIDNLI